MHYKIIIIAATGNTIQHELSLQVITQYLILITEYVCQSYHFGLWGNFGSIDFKMYALY